jgi:carbamoyl-phosphate synthase large subunit
MSAESRRQCRVLVTGAGSGVGQGIVKALRVAGLPITIVGADIAPMNAALYRTDEAVLIPRVESEGALEQIIDGLRTHRIDVLMVGSEFDLEFFAAHRATIEEASGTQVIAAALETVHIAGDKWLTAEFLREHGLSYAQSALPVDLADAVRIAADWGYPVVLKTRQGTSSRHVHIVRDRRMLEEVYGGTPLPMLQRLLDVPRSELNTEYTCSVFKARDGSLLGPFTARRTVRGGTSWHIEVAPFTALHPLLLGIGNAMDFVGSLNVQLMLTPAGPVPFELNARFSGTTAIRAHFGFNEPSMTLKSYFYHETLTAPAVRSGVAMRYHEEVFVDDVSAADLSAGRHTGYVNPWF